MGNRELSHLTQTAIGPKTVEFENIVQQAQHKKITYEKETMYDRNRSIDGA